MAQYRIITTVAANKVGDVIRALDAFDAAPDIQRVDGAPMRKPYPIMSDTRGGKIVLGAMISGTIYSSPELGEALFKAGLKRATVSSIMSGLVREGKVTKVSKGHFQLGAAL